MIKPLLETNEPVHPFTRQIPSTKQICPELNSSVGDSCIPLFDKWSRSNSLIGNIPSSLQVRSTIKWNAITATSTIDRRNITDQLILKEWRQQRGSVSIAIIRKLAEAVSQCLTCAAVVLCLTCAAVVLCLTCAAAVIPKIPPTQSTVFPSAI